MSKSDLNIDILGTEFTIATDEDPEYLDMLLDKFRQTIENVKHISGLKDPLKLAVLTGFLISDELEKATNGISNNKTIGEAEELTAQMISRLDRALKAIETALPDPAEASVGADDAAPEEAYAAPATVEQGVATEDTNAIEVSPFYKLENTVKNYDWGSQEWLPAFMGRKNSSRIPWAELWLGVNPSGPSRLADPDWPGCTLSELIGRAPIVFLGKEIAKKYGGALPFLLKVIAAAKPLSIQVHPNAEQAREGFDRENREGIPLGAPNRNYKDPNLKSEILYALSPFAALCGFRKAEEITLLMDILLLCTEISESGLRDSIGDLVAILKSESGENLLECFLKAVFALDRETLLGIGSFIKAKLERLGRDFPEYKDEWHLSAYLAALHPGDPGILAPLYLNILELEPEEAIFIPAGTPHAYINGMGIELLSNSDNVLRGGLTSKHVDHAELMKITDFTEFMPKTMRPLDLASLYIYPAGEFSLSLMRCGGHEALQYADPGPSILLVTEGRALLGKSAADDILTPLIKGESAFIPAGKNTRLSGDFTACIASCRSL